MDTDPVLDSPTACLLLVVAQAARGEELRRRLTSLSRGRQLELCLLAPAFAGSGLEYVASDVDPGTHAIQVAHSPADHRGGRADLC